MARRKILGYTHPAPPAATANPQQVAGFKAFSTWRSNITDEMLKGEEWVAYLSGAAEKSAEREERAVQAAAMAKWDK